MTENTVIFPGCQSVEDMETNKCGGFHSKNCVRCNKFICGDCHGLFSVDLDNKEFICGTCHCDFRSSRDYYIVPGVWRFWRN
jgi:hypothetical protein